MTEPGRPGRLGAPPPPRPRFARTRAALARPRTWIVLAATVVGAAALLLLFPSGSEDRWTGPPVVEPPVETLESRWLHEADAWLAWVEDARLDPQHLAVQRCGNEFDRTVGVPPSERLDAFAELFRDVVSHVS